MRWMWVVESRDNVRYPLAFLSFQCTLTGERVNIRTTVAAIAVIGSFSAPALACTCGGPGISQFRVGGDGSVPANALGVLWETDFIGLEPAQNVWVEQVDGEVRTRVEFTVETTLPGLYLIRPANWSEGNTYRVHVEVPERDELKGFMATERILEVSVEVGAAVDDSIQA